MKYHLRSKKPGIPREHFAPLRSTAEMAEEFGITPKALAAQIRESNLAPRPELENAKGRWWTPSKLREWYNAKEQARLEILAYEERQVFERETVRAEGAVALAKRHKKR